MANVKIQELTAENTLTDNHLVITDDSTQSAETKKSTIGMIKNYVLNAIVGKTILTYASSTAYAVGNFAVYDNCLYCCNTAYTSGASFDSTKWDKIGGDIDFSALTAMLVAGANFTITTDSENKTFTFAVDGHTISNYTSGENYVVGDIVIYQSSTYQCNTAYTSTENFDSSKWTVISAGQAGANAYVWIKYSAENPTQDSDMSDTPNKYIGIYSGTATTAPSTYTSYTWYKYKGETGATGTAGSHIYTGIAITGTNTTPTAYNTNITYANVDDLYISTAAGSVDNLYKCTTAGNDSTALWAYMNSIKGGGAQIDDTVTSATAVWSSNKINDELANKQNKVTVSNTYTLTVAGWDSTAKTQTVNMTLNTNNINEIIPDLSCRDTIGNCKVEPSAEATTGITFSCNTIPASDITFKMAITEVQV